MANGTLVPAVLLGQGLLDVGGHLRGVGRDPRERRRGTGLARRREEPLAVVVPERLEAHVAAHERPERTERTGRHRRAQDALRTASTSSSVGRKVSPASDRWT